MALTTKTSVRATPAHTATETPSIEASPQHLGWPSHTYTFHATCVHPVKLFLFSTRPLAKLMEAQAADCGWPRPLPVLACARFSVVLSSLQGSLRRCQTCNHASAPRQIALRATFAPTQASSHAASASPQHSPTCPLAAIKRISMSCRRHYGPWAAPASAAATPRSPPTHATHASCRTRDTET